MERFGEKPVRPIAKASYRATLIESNFTEVLITSITDALTPHLLEDLFLFASVAGSKISCPLERDEHVR